MSNLVVAAIPAAYMTGLIGLVWTLTTAFFSNGVNTMFVMELPSAVAHNLSRFFGSAFICVVLGFTLVKSIRPKFTPAAFKAFAPVAIVVCLMNIANSVALASVGVTMTYTIKSTIPVWTCLHQYLFKGQKFSYQIILALLMSCVGVALAAAGDVSFNAYGLTFAFVSCLAQTAFSIMSKDAMEATGLTKAPIQGFATTMSIAAIIATGFYLIEDFVLGLPSFPVYSTALTGLAPAITLISGVDVMGYGKLTDVFPEEVIKSTGPKGEEVLSVGWTYAKQFGAFETDFNYRPAMIVAMAGASYFCEYGLNFMYVARVTPVTFAITDIARRLGTILANAVVFGYTFTALNTSGIILGLAGALAYALINAREHTKVGAMKKAADADTIKPMKRSTSPMKRSNSPSPSPKSKKSAPKSPVSVSAMKKDKRSASPVVRSRAGAKK